MSQEKMHTPGPWFAYAGHNPARWFVGGHHYGSEIDASDICELRNDNREANARLIAAAPDLLDAAFWAEKALERYVDALGLGQTDEAALVSIYKIKDAIVSATGEATPPSDPARSEEGEGR